MSVMFSHVVVIEKAAKTNIGSVLALSVGSALRANSQSSNNTNGVPAPMMFSGIVSIGCNLQVSSTLSHEAFVWICTRLY